MKIILTTGRKLLCAESEFQHVSLIFCVVALTDWHIQRTKEPSQRSIQMSLAPQQALGYWLADNKEPTTDRISYHLVHRATSGFTWCQGYEKHNTPLII
jgi:hypothetical protein